ncbi:hypothetical protein G4D82_12530 [Flavobacterium sp. CYK-4]|uniref:hypothetical protein n=1 Tax=Flavobacterium lotistagni TaxID=2709660 RepID=UPI00140E7142|nr:hypothetical protein [Flavobacterium lotistagni]NHM08050.1 hypothetical protein [Flavobacterium lotistagni]
MKNRSKAAVFFELMMPSEWVGGYGVFLDEMCSVSSSSSFVLIQTDVWRFSEYL